MGYFAEQVLIFGSFSDDETRLFQEKADDKSVSPFEMVGFQFGSLDIKTLSSVKGFGSGFKQNASTKPNHFPPAAPSKDDEAVTGQVDIQITELEPNATDNGCVPICSEVITDEIIHKGMNSPKILEDDICNSDLPCPTVQDNGIEMLSNHNGFFSITAAVKDVEIVESSKLTPLFSGLLPRGLINLGNLCFLNSTLQALLSCSPFVQLVLDLKTRNVPKVSFKCTIYLL